MGGNTHERIRARRIRVRAMHGEGRTVSQIALILAVGTQTIYRDLSTMGLGPVRGQVRPRGQRRRRVEDTTCIGESYCSRAAMAGGRCLRHPDRPAVTTGSDIPLCAECDAETRLPGGALEYEMMRGRHSVAWDVERSK